jgi:DNA-binding PadR family transcriptional regulator
LIQGQAITSVDAPTRVEYTLTPAGESRLEAWLTEPHPSASIRRVRVEFLSRLYISRLLNIPTVDLVRSQKRSCRQRRAEKVTERDAAAPGIGRLTLELELAQLDAIMQWIDRCEFTPHEEEV